MIALKYIKKSLLQLEKIASQLLPFLVASALITIPLYPKFPLFEVPGIQVAIRLEDFLIVILAGVWFLSAMTRIHTKFFSREWRPVLIFLFVGLTSVISAIYLTKTVVPHVAILHLARRAQYLICLLVAYDSVREKKHFALYIKCLFVVLVYLFFVGVGQKHFQLPIITTQNEEYSKGLALTYMPGGHLVTTFAGHYDLATFLVVVLPIVLSFALMKRTGSFLKKNIQMLTLLAMWGMGIWLLTHAASRTSIVSMLLSTVATLILVSRKKWIIPAVVIILVSTGLTGSLVGRYMNIIDVTVKKVLTIAVPIAQAKDETPTTPPAPILEDRSMSIRLNVEWPRAIRAFLKNPLLGTGFSSITLATDNGYLRLLGEIGLLGFFAFFLIIADVSKRLYKSMRMSIKDSPQFLLSASLLGAIPGVLLNMVFIDVFESSKFAMLFWLMVGISLSSMLYKKGTVGQK